FSSLEEDCPLPDCSVWKGDFLLNGYVEQSPLWNLDFLAKKNALKCVEDSEIEFRSRNGLLYTENNVPDGIFYCYDPNNYLDMMELDNHDKVILNFSSDYALYPGKYNIGVMPMEMERDVSPPVMELIILNGSLFSGEDFIPIRLNVSDMYNIMSVEYEIMNSSLSGFYSSGWISVDFNEETGLYEDDFNIGEYELNESGSYWIKARSCDVLGNCGEL
ncbi:MAG: hypothetical protein OEL87_02660, partial [Nanoarchaeota archaeon]|nr:hypothetical protein [Nanoarchaeota archaeon]